MSSIWEGVLLAQRSGVPEKQLKSMITHITDFGQEKVEEQVKALKEIYPYERGKSKSRNSKSNAK